MFCHPYISFFHLLVNSFCVIRECGSTLYVRLQHAVPPTNTKLKPLLLPSQAGMLYTNTHKHRTSYFKPTLSFLGPAKCWRPSLPPDKIGKFLLFFIKIRECGSTLYVGLAHTAPPINTNFRLTFLRTRLQKALYGHIPV